MTIEEDNATWDGCWRGLESLVVLQSKTGKERAAALKDIQKMDKFLPILAKANNHDRICIKIENDYNYIVMSTIFLNICYLSVKNSP